MFIRIENPSSQLDWIVIQTDEIVSITPSDNTPNHCIVNLANGRSFHLTLEKLDKLIEPEKP